MNVIGIVGESGTGKTTGLRNLDPNKTIIISPYKDNLSFRGAKKNYLPYDKETNKGNFIKNNSLKALPKIINTIATERPEVKYLVVEDFTHMFNAYTLSDEFRKRSAGGEAFKRYADFGADAYSAMFGKVKDIRADLWLILHFHAESYMSDSGDKLKIKTPGSLLEREVDIPSYFTYLLYTKVYDPDTKENPKDRYVYVTNNDGYRPAKTPIDCFDKLEVPNDLNDVLNRIEKYEQEG